MLCSGRAAQLMGISVGKYDDIARLERQGASVCQCGASDAVDHEVVDDQVGRTRRQR